MKDLLEFKNFLLEAKEVIDLRHRDFRQEKEIDPIVKNTNYIDPKNGFYWSYFDGILILSSHENKQVSSYLKYAEQHDLIPSKIHNLPKKNAQEIGRSWNQLGGRVDFSSKTITIDKELLNKGTRQRIVANIKEFKQALQSLQKYKITLDFKIKGTPAHIPKTVGAALQLRNSLDSLLDLKEVSYMFHGTSTKRWESIQHRGLIPRILDTKRSDKDDVYVDLIPNYSEHNVYVTTTKKSAEFYAKRQAQKDNSDPIMLKIEVPDKSKLIPDDIFVDREMGTYTFSGFKSSVYTLGELAYKGIILPKFIKPIK